MFTSDLAQLIILSCKNNRWQPWLPWMGHVRERKMPSQTSVDKFLENSRFVLAALNAAHQSQNRCNFLPEKSFQSNGTRVASMSTKKAAEAVLSARGCNWSCCTPTHLDVQEQGAFQLGLIVANQPPKGLPWGQTWIETGNGRHHQMGSQQSQDGDGAGQMVEGSNPE